MRRFWAAVFVLASGAVAGRTARGDLVVYTESFVASGSLGGQSFTDAAVTLTAYGDPSTYFSTPAVAFVDAPTAIVAVAGLATATFSDTLDVFVAYNPSFGGIFGFSDFNSTNPDGDILDVRNPAFLAYNLLTPLGPTVGEFADFSVLNSPNATSAGDLIFTSVDPDVTVTAVPEPSSLALAGIGGLGLLGYARKRRAR